MKTFSSLMRAARTTRKMSFTKLAKDIGYHASYLSMVERGLRQVDESGVVRIAEALGIEPSEALLASLRERLPDEMRCHVPTGNGPVDREQGLVAMRQLQAEHFDYEVDSHGLHGSIDWDGNLRTVRTFDGCRPNAAGRPVWNIRFHERVYGNPADGTLYPKFNVRKAPADLEYEHNSFIDGARHRHELFFPKGWTRTGQQSNDAFSFSFETYQAAAYVLDASSLAKMPVADTLHSPLTGSFSLYMRRLVKRLELAVDFPPGYVPDNWEAWAWWGSATLPTVPRNLADHGVCRSLTFKAKGGTAKLVVEEPLAGYTFSIVWAPATRQHYLEARHGYSSDKP